MLTRRPGGGNRQLVHMADFNVRSDSVNVEQIMEQIRARIREKRGVDYTEQQIRDLAAVKLEKFLDPRGVRSDLLEQFRKAQPAYVPPELPNYAFEDKTLYESTRPPLRWIRKLLNPILKLFFNPNPLIQALNIQSRLNTMYSDREARREATRRAFDQLQYELMHNLVIETTRMSIEVKNLKMRVESLASRLEFNERRARALESVVAYQPSDERESPPSPGAVAIRDSRGPWRQEPEQTGHRERNQHDRRDAGRASQPSQDPLPRPDQRAAAGPGQGPAAGAAPGGQAPTTPAQGQPEGPGQRSRRRRRRRGRRGGGSAAAIMGAAAAPIQTPPGEEGGALLEAADPEAGPPAHDELDDRPTQPAAPDLEGGDAREEAPLVPGDRDGSEPSDPQ
jgi:hypothetical protein